MKLNILLSIIALMIVISVSYFLGTFAQPDEYAGDVIGAMIVGFFLLCVLGAIVFVLYKKIESMRN